MRETLHWESQTRMATLKRWRYVCVCAAVSPHRTCVAVHAGVWQALSGGCTRTQEEPGESSSSTEAPGRQFTLLRMTYAAEPGERFYGMRQHRPRTLLSM
jgi:hypothetical protein